jgi:hypothetical protein
MTNPSIAKLASYARDFDLACDALPIKIAVIVKLPSGRWGVRSEKGKNLGEYDTKELAVKRLKQVEWFKFHKPKHKKKASKEESYSSVMRDLNKADDKDAMKRFQTAFKEAFDDALLDGGEHPEEEALEKAFEAIDGGQEALEKAASAINLGDPDTAGQYLAQLLKFVLRRISPERRGKSIENLKRKVYYINEYDLAAKRSPASASIGNSITLLKTLLLEHKPEYIRATLNSVVKYL